MFSQNLVESEAYGPKVQSLGAVNVGSSVLACKWKDGVIIAADKSITYGGLLKIKDGERCFKLSDECAFACGGEMADAQNLKKMLDQKQEADEIAQDGATFLKPSDYFTWISRTCYQRRMKMNPLWCSTILGGVEKDSGKVFLGQCDLYGMRLEENFLLTGLSAHYCQVLMQNQWRADMTLEEAKALLMDCFRVLFYRDKKSHDVVQFVSVTQAGGVKFDEPVTVDTEWNRKFDREMTNEFWRPMRIRM